MRPGLAEPVARGAAPRPTSASSTTSTRSRPRRRRRPRRGDDFGATGAAACLDRRRVRAPAAASRSRLAAADDARQERSGTPRGRRSRRGRRGRGCPTRTAEVTGRLSGFVRRRRPSSVGRRHRPPSASSSSRVRRRLARRRLVAASGCATRLISPLGDVPGHAVGVAQAGHAQAHPLDRPGRRADVDLVAHAVLVLEDHEQPGEVVAHHRLRAERRARRRRPRPPAISGPRSTPISPRTIRTAIVQTTIDDDVAQHRAERSRRAGPAGAWPSRSSGSAPISPSTESEPWSRTRCDHPLHDPVQRSAWRATRRGAPARCAAAPPARRRPRRRARCPVTRRPACRASSASLRGPHADRCSRRWPPGSATSITAVEPARLRRDEDVGGALAHDPRRPAGRHRHAVEHVGRPPSCASGA